ncbi:cohesin domain-containing protein [Methylomonas rosea]|uniref:Cohesin domain-containing protein n=1 Tax=Methylomonas rosea TaxID=2952227 RepID=A0ABT1TNA1_9GAMM|nr:cohesin domain-containing protein [Methylomonas sp. WSC-7]MCQ8115861.1 cohesin domain-containing protein [Methylomonas sp. WSC-7]
MNKNLFIRLLALAAAGFFHTAEATTLSLKFPNNSNIYTTTVGSFFDANIYVDGLPDFGAFDLTLTYNSNNLSAQSLNSTSIFGTDDSAVFINTITPGIGGSGSIHFAEDLSPTSSANAGLNITGPTLLGTITFKALSVSAINTAYLINFSASSEIYTFDGTSIGGTAQGGNVKVTAVPAAVPLPASIFLFVPGLLAVFGARKSIREIAA